MINKKDPSDPIDNLEYEKVLEEEIINSYESKFQKDTEEGSKKIKFYRLKRTCLLYTSPSPRDYAASRMPSSA